MSVPHNSLHEILVTQVGIVSVSREQALELLESVSVHDEGSHDALKDLADKGESCSWYGARGTVTLILDTTKPDGDA